MAGQSIFLDFPRTLSSRVRCTFPGCNKSSSNGLHDVSRSSRYKVMNERKIYIPVGARACYNHLKPDAWNGVILRNQPGFKYTKKQVEDAIQLLCNPTSKIISNSPVGPHNTETMKTYIGLNEAQFHRVLRAVVPIGLPSFKNLENLTMSLYIYLMKLKTNQTYAQIAPHFNLSSSMISPIIRKMRNITHKALAPLYLYNWSRNEILRNTTPLSRKLYGVNDDVAIVSWDGTYVFVIKSSNYSFQKNSYSQQHERNLVKFMNCVTTNGLIIGAYGPFEAKKNDATILKEILNEQSNVFDKLRPGDIMVIDRGFRDCTEALKRRGFIIKTPKGTKQNQMTQMNRFDTNESRFATKTRFVVEVRNTHIKNKYKYLSATKDYQSIPKLKNDFQVCASLVNAFCAKIESDKYDWNYIGNRMIEKINEKSPLRKIVQHIASTSFTYVKNLTLFPKYTYVQLKDISLGSYQIRQAKSYCQYHVMTNDNDFIIKVCDPNVCQQLCGKLLIGTSSPLLLSIDLRSRFKAKTTHKVYLLLSLDNKKKYVVSSYCCSCRHGCRTVGCCSHVMLLIWFVLYVDHSTMKKKFPSSNLDRVFGKWADENYFMSSDSGSNSDFHEDYYMSSNSNSEFDE